MAEEGRGGDTLGPASTEQDNSLGGESCAMSLSLRFLQTPTKGFHIAGNNLLVG